MSAGSETERLLEEAKTKKNYITEKYKSRLHQELKTLDIDGQLGDIVNFWQGDPRFINYNPMIFAAAIKIMNDYKERALFELGGIDEKGKPDINKALNLENINPRLLGDIKKNQDINARMASARRELLTYIIMIDKPDINDRTYFKFKLQLLNLL
ncbi:MAG: hypothetical protein Solumvirus6_9 [Solumvirus sp.]|uniref:Uncharacterized protein n=1 Tax=Solumvirus sp. TaxID=2487773 RepID=A0A3G5AIF4_9VIRU|nr:MAG: hypothetical protein Solumvirus6_9 [Solumvirus sp.]